MCAKVPHSSKHHKINKATGQIYKDDGGEGKLTVLWY